MPNIIYDYQCPKCKKVFEVIHVRKSLEEAQSIEVKCKDCQSVSKRLPANSNFKPFEWA